MTKPRYLILDHIRGLAVVLMVFFHFSYDLNVFGFIKVDMFNDPFWFGLLQKMYVLRKVLHPMNIIDSMEFILSRVTKSKTNGEFLESMNG